MGAATMERARTLQVWKTVSLGTVPDARLLKSMLRETDCVISYNANAVMNSGSFKAVPQQECELVVVTARDLGLKFGERIGRFYEYARREGYLVCPPETAVQLILQRGSEIHHECLRVAMEPIHYCRNEDLFVIGRNDNGLFLDTSVGHLTYLLPSPDVEMVFRRV
jgi:hypothetical protein